MIIKAYTNQFPGQCVLIDGAQDVIIHRNLFSDRDVGPDYGINITCMRYIDDPEKDTEIKAPTDHFMFIDYVQKGIGTRLVIRNYAYVCNDDGKTIEKVSTK